MKAEKEAGSLSKVGIEMDMESTRVNLVNKKFKHIGAENILASPGVGSSCNIPTQRMIDLQSEGMDNYFILLAVANFVVHLIYLDIYLHPCIFPTVIKYDPRVCHNGVENNDVNSCRSNSVDTCLHHYKGSLYLKN